MSTVYFARHLFETVLDELTGNEEDVAKVLDAYFHMFKEEVLESIQLAERGCVTLIYATNQRQAFEVKNNGKTYVCFKHTFFCNCFSYSQNVIKSGEVLLCKHLIASRLAERTNKCKYKSVSDEYLINLFKNSEERYSQ